MNILLAFLLGVSTAHLLSQKKMRSVAKDFAPVRTQELIVLLREDMVNMLELSKRVINDDDDLDPKYFYTRRPDTFVHKH